MLSSRVQVPGYNVELVNITATDATEYTVYSGKKPAQSVFILERLDPSTNSLVNLDPSSLLSEVITVTNYKSDGATPANSITYPKYTYVTTFKLNNSGSQTNTSKLLLAVLIPN